MTDKLKIDLHTHSTASDGTLSPAELARHAKNCGLSAVALTDHDTTDGLNEFMKECSAEGIEGIPGVEVSARFSKTLHIVGLFIDANSSGLNKKLSSLRGGRAERNRAVIKLLRDDGFDISEEDILSLKDDATLDTAGRPHIARVLVNKGYAEDVSDAFNKYLKKGLRYYVKRLSYSPRESIEMIKRAGGVAILAHPVLISDDYDTLFAVISELKEYGLDGIECYYNSYTKEFSDMCLDLCKKLSLLRSGGSDFHGANKPGVNIGVVSTGSVPYDVLEDIKLLKGTI